MWNNELKTNSILKDISISILTAFNWILFEFSVQTTTKLFDIETNTFWA